MTKPYFVPLTEIRREHEVLKSRFIATLAPAFSIDEARALCCASKRKFLTPVITCLCTSSVGGNTATEYFSDDGEAERISGKTARHGQTNQ